MSPKKSGVYDVFTAKDGRKVTLRQIRWEDLDDCLEFINSLVEEGAEILRDTAVTREEEADWLGTRLARIEKEQLIGVAAEVNGKMIANSEVEKRSGFMSHVGYLGIGIKKGYRGIGIGSRLIQILINESKKAGLKSLSSTFSTLISQLKPCTKRWASKKRAESQTAFSRMANTWT